MRNIGRERDVFSTEVKRSVFNKVLSISPWISKLSDRAMGERNMPFAAYVLFP